MLPELSKRLISYCKLFQWVSQIQQALADYVKRNSIVWFIPNASTLSQ